MSDNIHIKREIVIKFKDNTEKRLPLSKATKLNVDTNMLHLDQLKDGSWRLIWNSELIEDFSQVDEIEIYREG